MVARIRPQKMQFGGKFPKGVRDLPHICQHRAQVGHSRNRVSAESGNRRGADASRWAVRRNCPTFANSGQMWATGRAAEGGWLRGAQGDGMTALTEVEKPLSMPLKSTEVTT
jgi:hypothetical protein